MILFRLILNSEQKYLSTFLFPNCVVCFFHQYSIDDCRRKVLLPCYICTQKPQIMFDSIVKYLEINIELVKLDIKEIIAKLIVDIIKLAVVGFLLSMGLVFLSIALGLWLGELTGSSITGTAIVGSLYVLAAIIFVAVRKKLRLLFEKAVAKYIPDNQKLINELNEHEKAEY